MGQGSRCVAGGEPVIVCCASLIRLKSWREPLSVQDMQGGDSAWLHTSQVPGRVVHGGPCMCPAPSHHTPARLESAGVLSLIPREEMQQAKRCVLRELPSWDFV